MGLKRKVSVFLFAVMLAVSLGATVVASLAMYRLVSEKQDAEIHRLESSLSDRFAVFETLLRSQHVEIVAHMEKVLPQIAAELDRTGRAPGDLTVADLDALTRKYGVQHIYFVDRAHRVFQTNLASDMNLTFPESSFTRFLDTVYSSNRVMSDGIDLSSLTGTLRTYSYFGPEGKDYIIETSTEVRASLAEGNFGWMGAYFFQDLFADALRSNPYLKEVDLYLVTPAGAWSLLHIGKKLEPALVERLMKVRREEVPAGDGRYLTVYSGEETRAGTQAGHPVTSKFVIRKITYDTGLAREAVLHVLLSSIIVLAVMLPIVFWIASRLLQRQLLDPLFSLRGEAGAIAEGDLDQAIANTNRIDEIGQLAKSFASMRDAVRRTILDLKHTNVSIERFVPQAFLSIVGKPSVADVELGDNKRRTMSILFSDIRGFTTLSEQMSPDETFAFINTYLERMGPVIRDHHGFIDKYIGDAIMALFANADDALQAGLAMLAALEGFNAERRATGLPPIEIGIGINTGSLMLGTIGEKHRMDGTVISDAVNLAARIEGLTKDYAAPMLISEFTYRELSNPEASAIRPVDVVVVKGKTRPVAIYAVSPSPA
ncbi:adenylate/guanylate cyclase domain-containing protein [Reyranella sp.]|uniref:adenylate/guanylate cyclase domain-containing protein n=1 Tax=Reyranella sp. TaxID=1929291 RepID=UPI002726CF1C|nr:adenylate/guanylate cyclase domain-containing protein [Reyranella sp.]MDO8976867.1 adenylate/guanylate cyclase domain-containing protein [Reyranella sp.]